MAEKHYKLSIDLKAANIPAYLCLGDVYIELKELTKAKNAFSEALIYDRNNEKAIDALQNVEDMQEGAKCKKKLESIKELASKKESTARGAMFKPTIEVQIHNAESSYHKSTEENDY